MSDTHEVYPNAPLALVAVEVRFPQVSGARTPPMPLQRAFRDLLGESWVIESVKTQHVEFAFGPSGPGQQNVQQVVVPRFTVRDRTLAVALTDESLTVETTGYRHYPDFRSVLERALGAAEELLSPDGVARAGMRYIDEVRVPDISDAASGSWKEWLDSSLLPPKLSSMIEEGFAPEGWEGAAQYATGPGRSLVLRYGVRSGYAVGPDGPLKRPTAPPSGPFFLLDFDSFWQPADIPEFSSEHLLKTCDELRKPARTLFDLVVSDRLRDEVFRKEPSLG